MITSNQSYVRFLARSSFRRLVFLVLATFFSAGLLPVRAQVNNGAQKKVLVFHLMGRDAATLDFARIYAKELSDGLAGRLDYYSEYIDLARFGGSDYQSAFRDFLKHKYKGTNFDLIIANADLRNFLARYGAEV